MKWKIVDVDEQAIIDKYHVGVLTAKLLAVNHLDDDKINSLLSNDINLTLSDSDCVNKACERILLARDRHEKVFVAGDYDADGICATAIMKATLTKLGIENGYYIPDRFKEGYGLNTNTVNLVHDKGYSLIITVDNGVKAHEALKLAKELGIDTIVTDHHTIEEEIESDIVVHPDYMEERYHTLSGAGVALEISMKLIGKYNSLIAMAGVSCISDVMPYYDESRKLILNAFDILKMNRPLSLVSLMDKGTIVNEESISYQIVPKLNCIGRLNEYFNVNKMPMYLLTTNSEIVKQCADKIIEINNKRKTLSNDMFKVADNQVNNEGIIVIYNKDFHEGLCGLVAGKLVSKYKRPSIVLCNANGLIKGSGRSVEGYDLFEALRNYDHFENFGGHKLATGLSFKEEYFEEFKTFLSNINLEIDEPMKIGIEITPNMVTFESIMDLENIAPYPKDLQEQLFALVDFEITNVKETAKMIRYSLKNDRGNLEAVVYKQRGIKVIDNPKMLIGKLHINKWMSRITCQLVIEEMF